MLFDDSYGRYEKVIVARLLDRWPLLSRELKSAESKGNEEAEGDEEGD